MPAVHDLPNHDAISNILPHLAPRAILHEIAEHEPIHLLIKRINVTVTKSSDPALKAASQQDPWNQSGKYAGAFQGFAAFLLAITFAVRVYHMWIDKVRRAHHKEMERERVHKLVSYESSPDDYEMKDIETPTPLDSATPSSTQRLFPPKRLVVPEPQPAPAPELSVTAPIVYRVLAGVRWLFYRPIPSIKLGKNSSIEFPTPGVLLIVIAAFTFTVLYAILPQPLFYQTIRFGSPPLAIRAGMLSVATIPWIIVLSTKANFVTLLTGLGHERLNGLHRWLGYLCLALAIIHIVPFYITPVWSDGGLPNYESLYQGLPYVYGTGIAALAPLGFLCLHSLPILRRRLYEVFVMVHAPVALVFIAMMIWHCQNFLSSWQYLFATLGIWLFALIYRLFFLNWTNYKWLSWLCGEECSIVLLPENAVKVTIPTRLRWHPGQFVYLRIPGISIFENHPFTIASLCSEDFPSEYGAGYRDAVLVFRPFGGFTRKVVDAAAANGPYHTYRAFLDGPYGGMRRELASFDTVVLIAGGSGITSIVSHLLLLIKKMRAGVAVVRRVHVIWVLKHPAAAEWFREELRICRQFAPPGSVHCQFFITAAKRASACAPVSLLSPAAGTFAQAERGGGADPRPTSMVLHDRLNDAFQGIADKRASALIREAAGDDGELARQLQREQEDAITALPEKKSPITAPSPAHLSPQTASLPTFPAPPTAPTLDAPPAGRFGIKPGRRPRPTSMKIEIPDTQRAERFDFGFPSTPTALQKGLVRFAFMPGAAGGGASGGAVGGKAGWQTEYGRPHLPSLLRGLRPGFGRRTCVFVCGPPGMREDVQRCVAGLQAGVIRGGASRVDEIFLHTENYAI